MAGEFAVALVALIYFVIGYVASSRGRALRSPEGRHMLNFRGSLAVFMAMGLVHNLVADYALRDAVRVAVIGWFAYAAVAGDVQMTRAQRERRRVRDAAQAPTRTPGI